MLGYFGFDFINYISAESSYKYPVVQSIPNTNMKQLSILVALVCVLAHVGSTRAQCCRPTMTVSYTVLSGRCREAGGTNSTISTCSVTICADGRPLVGNYCGRRSCNIFGCNCGGGCLSGNWANSFAYNYRRFKVRVLSTRWS